MYESKSKDEPFLNDEQSSSSNVVLSKFRSSFLSDDKIRNNSHELRDSGINSTWVADFADNYDYCMVLPLELDSEGREKLTQRGIDYTNKLLSIGFDLFAYVGLNKKEIFVLIRCKKKKDDDKDEYNMLREYADKTEYVLKLDEKEIENAIKAGDPEHNIKGLPNGIPNNKEVVSYEPYQYIYAKYSLNVPEKLYFFDEGLNHPFRDHEKLKLMALLIESKPPAVGSRIKIRRYLGRKWVLAFFPLHDRKFTEILSHKWLSLSVYPWNSPVTSIKEYYGEKIGLFFHFLGHYTSLLRIPAFIGFVLQIAVIATGNFSLSVLPGFSFILSIWAIFMLEYWKRLEKRIALEWGSTNFEDNEVDRSDFNGEEKESYINGAKIVYFPNKKRSILVMQSFGVVAILIIIVIGVVTSIYLIRYSLVAYGNVSVSDSQTVASVLNAVQIQFTNAVYSFLAKVLNDRENHRTDTNYEDSMVSKIFAFQFVNSYASFFYIAFIAESLGECDRNGCMESLATNLGIIFGSRLATINILELVIPYLQYQYSYNIEIAEYGNKMSRPEKEFLLQQYDVMSASIGDYAEVAIQYGYTALFASALPIASLFAFFSNLIEAKGKAWKLLNLHQRPVLKGAQDIGTWQSIFLLMAIITVVTNAGLTVFTMTVFDQYSLTIRLWIFLAFQWICFSCQYFVMELIPDVPEEIEVQLKRQQFIIDKLIDKVADEPEFDDEEPPENIRSSVYLQDYPMIGGNYLHGTHNILTQNMK